MQRRFGLSSSPFLLLSLLLLFTLHGKLVTAQVFTFPTGQNDKGSLSFLQHASLDSSGTLTLDSSAGDAQAFYHQTIPLLDASGQSVVSFSSIFTVVSNATNANGTIAFAVTQSVTGGLAEARKTLTVEFKTSCAYGGNGFYGGGAWGGMGRGNRGGGYGGRFGGSGGFGQPVEYVNDTSFATAVVGGYGPAWTGSPPQGPYFCSLSLSYPTFQYQVAVEYNASSNIVSVGSPSCGADLALTTQFPPKALSGVITKPVSVGFFVTGGAVYNITRWNFSSNTNTSAVANLALSSIASGSSGSSSGGRPGHSNGGLKKGYIIGFSVLGAAIGVAAVLLVCCLCARRRRATSTRFVAKSVYSGTIPERAVVFDAKKPNAPPAKVVLVEKDTIPLNARPHSASNGSTGAASWLQPVQPR